jgi:hypothetical protein
MVFLKYGKIKKSRIVRSGLRGEIPRLGHCKTRKFVPCLVSCSINLLKIPMHHEDFGKKVQVNYFDMSGH